MYNLVPARLKKGYVMEVKLINIVQFGHIQKLCVHDWSEYIRREPEDDRYIDLLVSCCLNCGKYLETYATEEDTRKLNYDK